MQAQDRLSAGDYHSASKRGTIAMILSVANVGYTLGVALIVIGSVLGPICANTNRYNYYRNSCG